MLLVLTIAALAAAVYAQWNLPRHSSSKRTLWISRLMLLLIGLAFAWAMSARYIPAEGWLRLLVFLSAFGLAHVPAAAILFLKSLRQQSLK